MGLPTPRPVPHKPFVQFWPSIAWTTLALTINADGTVSHEVVGASPFPRHWIYDHDGKLIEKSAIIDFRKWFNESYGDRTPWGDTDSDAVVTAVGPRSSDSSRRRSCRAAQKPKIRSLKEGDALVEQGKPGSEVYLILDGMFVVEVDGVKVGEVGPGAVVGERSALERGLRTATLWAATKARVAETSPDGLDLSDLRALAETHRSEES